MKLTASLILVLFLIACKKESYTSSPDALIRVGADTVHFDTVFATAGSTTQAFKVFNDNKKGIHVSSIQLRGGAASPFKININGIPGPNVTSLDIPGDDSAYVFLTVTVNPTTATLPFVVRDSIEINYNGNKKIVQLEAFGKNAHFFRNRTITSDETWNNDLPYVILDKVEIAANAKLTINKGCNIFFHANAPMIVKGSLVVTGEKWDSTRVVFNGDRLDEPYKNFPASWPGIYFNNSSKDNSFKYAIIKNAYQALVVQTPSVNSNPKLEISETIIDNAYDAGLLGVNTSIRAQNLLISNSGKNLLLVNGGDYQFTHCTVATYSNSLLQHKDPVLLVSNYLSSTPPNSLTASFKNCIFWGEGGIVDNEVSVLRNGGNTFNVSFNNVLWKMKDAPANVIVSNILNNQDPRFDSISTEREFYSFRLKDSSPALDKGINTSVTLDLDGKQRPVGLPDLGSYEKQ